MRIIGYCYNAAYYCPACTKADWRSKTLRYPRTLTIECLDRDEHDLPMHMRDEVGNPTSPIFSTDSVSTTCSCAACEETIASCIVEAELVE